MLAGIFVGGAATRMGGVAKGLLIAPDGEPIVVRTLRLLRDLRLTCALVGNHAAYAEIAAQFDVPMLTDEPPGIGPLGGLIALLNATATRAGLVDERGNDQVLAIGGDMPYITSAMLMRLLAEQGMEQGMAQGTAPVAAAVAPHVDGRWQPLFARYTVQKTLPLARRRAANRQLSLHGLLDALMARSLHWSEAEIAGLRDWDEPGDVQAQ